MMSKIISLIIVITIVILAYFLFSNPKESYRFFTGNTETNQPAIRNATDLPQNAENWHEYTAVNRSFRVLLPTLPQHITEQANDPKSKEVRKYDTYVSTAGNGTTYWINMISSFSHRIFT